MTPDRLDGATPSPLGPSAPAWRDAWPLVVALRSGDEAAFLGLVKRYHRAMVRIARTYLRSDAAAEDAVQEAWLGVVKGIEGFEGRASVKSWIFRITAYCARARSAREGRLVPLSSLEEDGEDGPAVDPDRFQPEGVQYANNWAQPPQPWSDELLVAAETAAFAKAEIERLPVRQRTVMTLRDVEGLDPDEVCAILGISEGNQRVLLHRARSKVRAALERHIEEGSCR